MAQFIITVLGATGNIGTPLVHQLLQAGHRVRAVARPSARLNALQAAGAEPVAGDLHDQALLTEALRGADAAFLMIPPNSQAADVLGHYDQIGEAIAQAAQASGLRRAVHLSSIGAELPAGTGPVVGVHRQEARLNALSGSGGLTVAHLRPAYFMENLFANLGLIQHMGIAGSAIRPDLPMPMVATRDIAARAAELLQASNFANHSVHYLLGPRPYTMRDAAAALGRAIGRPKLPYVQFPYEDAQKGMRQAGLSENMAHLYDELTRNINAEGAMISAERTPDRTTPTTLDEFAETAFAPAFRAMSNAGQ